MFKRNIGLLALVLLHACATNNIGSGNAGGSITQHSFPLGNGKEFVFQKSNCKIEGGALKSNGGYASAGSYGTLNVSNSVGKAVLDKYHVSCGAVRNGDKSTCVIQHVDGGGSARDYGGVACPDMKFDLVDFRLF